jgi:ATP-dependent DNA helicase RecQ
MPGIVYCSTRKAVDTVRGELIRHGVGAVRYHAGLEDSERAKNQDDFIYDRATVMVATNAFGMGIDKSNVRYVIHYNMPGSIDSYYQEAGRAGRDGSPADCILLFGRQDVSTIRFLISKGEGDDTKKSNNRKLKDMIGYCHTSGCLRRHILQYFGETSDRLECGACGNCRSIADRRDVTTDAQKILSCVYRAAERTGGRKYGSVMISDILRGRPGSARREQITSLGLDSISTWGIMNGSTQAEIMDAIDFLVAERYLDADEYGALSFTNRSFPFLKSKTRLLMRNYREPAKKERPKTKPAFGSKDAGLFEKLRGLRREIASSKNVPPYVVFSDKTLTAMCETLPSDEEEFLAIAGVGDMKLKEYGTKFLEVIKNWMG